LQGQPLAYARGTVLSLPIASEDKLQSELELPRINLRAGDHAVIRRPELIPRRAPDRVIRKIEDLSSEFDKLRLGQIELLVERGVETNDAGADDRISRGIAITEWPDGGNPIYVSGGIEEACARLLAPRQIGVRPGRKRPGLKATALLLAEKRPALKRIDGEGRISDSGAPLIKAPPVWGENFFAFSPTKPRALGSI
jgi:hypothetical protein